MFVIKEEKIQVMIALSDRFRPSVLQTTQLLNERGIESVMITGDNEKVVRNVGKELGLTYVFAEVLPDEKSKKIQQLKEKGTKKVAMVGDGNNDGPALAEPDLGMAIRAGTYVAMEIANIILVDSDPRDVINVINLSTATYKKYPESYRGCNIQYYCYPSCRWCIN